MNSLRSLRQRVQKRLDGLSKLPNARYIDAYDEAAEGVTYSVTSGNPERRTELEWVLGQIADIATAQGDKE